MQPGLYPRGSVDYDAIDAVRFSSLKEMARSPKRYAHRLRHPRTDTEALQRGRIDHVAVLEPERLTLDLVLAEQGLSTSGVAIYTGPVRRGAAFEAFKAANPGKAILIRSELVGAQAELERAQALAAAVRADPAAAPLLARGTAEHTAVWRDSTGLLCKGRIDWLDGEDRIVELKTARDVEAARFGTQAARLQYHEQLAWYVDGVEAATGHRPQACIIAVESEPPHDVVVYDLDEEQLEIGREGYRRLLEQLAECIRTETWPGYARGARMPLQLPAWLTADSADDEVIGEEWEAA